MIAMLITKGTKYDCNLGHEADPIWLQAWSQKGLDMIAMLVKKGTKYDCNHFQKGPNMIAMSKFVLESRDYDFWVAIIIGPPL